MRKFTLKWFSRQNKIKCQDEILQQALIDTSIVYAEEDVCDIDEVISYLKNQYNALWFIRGDILK